MVSERDAAILARYADGATLEEIGNQVGLTRERVRQIVAKHGGVASEEARRRRLADRTATKDAARDGFLLEHDAVARALAAQGFSRAVAITRLKALFPAVDVELADEALRRSSIVFDQEPVDNIFSDAALEAGVWFLLGSELRLKSDPAWAAVNLSEELLEELGPALDAASVSPDEVATILGVIGAAQRHALSHPITTITGERYQALRLELLEAMGLASAKGASPWPPTRQTISKRFGGWNDALIAMGLATAKKGRSKGLVVFTEADYPAALRDFAAFCAASGVAPTYANYARWVHSRRSFDERRPSAAAVRNLYGSWLAALRVTPETSAAAGGDDDAGAVA